MDCYPRNSLSFAFMWLMTGNGSHKQALHDILEGDNALKPIASIAQPLRGSRVKGQQIQIGKPGRWLMITASVSARFRLGFELDETRGNMDKLQIHRRGEGPLSRSPLPLAVCTAYARWKSHGRRGDKEGSEAHLCDTPKPPLSHPGLSHPGLTLITYRYIIRHPPEGLG